MLWAWLTALAVQAGPGTFIAIAATVIVGLLIWRGHLIIKSIGDFINKRTKIRNRHEIDMLKLRNDVRKRRERKRKQREDDEKDD